MKTDTPWTSPEKIEARDVTIVAAYRLCSGRESIPEGTQYITLSGLMVSEDKLHPACEIKHLISRGLIQPHQFIGIDNNAHPKYPDVVERNLSALRQEFPTNTPRMLKGDICDVLEDLYRQGDLRPAIVNIDLMVAPRAGQRTLSRVLNLLNLVPGPTLVIWNVMVENHYSEDLRYGLDNASVALLRAIKEGGWKKVVFGEDDYEYPGIGTRTTMRSVLFWRPQP